MTQTGRRETLASNLPLCSLVFFRPHQQPQIDLVHMVIAGFIWAFAEPAHNLFLFLPIDVGLAKESEFFLEQQMWLVHLFAVTICAVVKKKKVQNC